MKHLKIVYLRNFFRISLQSALNRILLILDVIALILLLFPGIIISPTIIVVGNLFIITISSTHIYIKRSYRNLDTPEDVLLEHTYHINALALSSDNKRLVSCSGDRYAILWDLETKRAIYRMKHPAWVGNIVFSGDDLLLFALSGKNENLFVWDLIYHEHLFSVEANAGDEGARGLALSKSGKKLVSSGSDGYVFIFDSIDLHDSPLKIKVSHKELRKVAVSEYGDKIFTGDTEGKVYQCSLIKNNKYEVKEIYTSSNNEMIRSVRLSTNGNLLSISDSGGWITLLRLSDMQSKTFKAHKGHAVCTAFTLNDCFLASGGQDEIIRIWDIRGNIPKKVLEAKGHNNSISAVLFNEYLELYSTGRDGKIMIWNLKGLY